MVSVETAEMIAGSRLVTAHALFELSITSYVVDLLNNARDATASIDNVEKLVGPSAGTWPQAVTLG
ncbi:hypothetical protein [Actinoplanes sp. NPDC049316]|uniref:hypothetical protein n=1 Tax=Actinoplanes sp. NPDC049316 TaxID=3154727 RepID=UPI003434A362